MFLSFLPFRGLHSQSAGDRRDSTSRAKSGRTKKKIGKSRFFCQKEREVTGKTWPEGQEGWAKKDRMPKSGLRQNHQKEDVANEGPGFLNASALRSFLRILPAGFRGRAGTV